MSTAVLDADVIAYVASAEAENHDDIHWGEGVTSEHAAFRKACEVAESMVQQWTGHAQATKTMLAFSGESYMNFRRDVHPLYKSHRTGEKPALYGKTVQWMKLSFPWVSYENLEGDDVIGMLVTMDRNNFIGVSTDKDLLTLPGRVVHIKKGQPHLYDLTVHEANFWWMQQTLMGDPVDGYKGAPGIGEKGALKLLSHRTTLGDLWEGVMEGYRVQHHKPKAREKFVTRSPESEAVMNAQCARILRHGDYDYKNQEVKLWVPQ